MVVYDAAALDAAAAEDIDFRQSLPPDLREHMGVLHSGGGGGGHGEDDGDGEAAREAPTDGANDPRRAILCAKVAELLSRCLSPETLPLDAAVDQVCTFATARIYTWARWLPLVPSSPGLGRESLSACAGVPAGWDDAWVFASQILRRNLRSRLPPRFPPSSPPSVLSRGAVPSTAATATAQLTGGSLGGLGAETLVRLTRHDVAQLLAEEGQQGEVESVVVVYHCASNTCRYQEVPEGRHEFPISVAAALELLLTS